MSATRQPILVIEDEPDIRDLMAEILEMAGYAVLLAAHGAQALQLLRAGNRPCLIVLDLMMPVMDGWTFCEEREKEPELARIPLLVVSAVARQDPRTAGLKAVGHVPKPLDVPKFLATVARYA